MALRFGPPACDLDRLVADNNQLKLKHRCNAFGERELVLVRQGLDAERKALVERERLLRRREVTEARESLTQPFATPSFSEGLAALARARSRD